MSIARIVNPANYLFSAFTGTKGRERHKGTELRRGEYITKAALDLLENNKIYRSVPKFWDGRAAQRIVEILKEIG